jgi:preprotein translocase subunit SecE
MKVSNYFTEAYTELVQKVTWPTWNELRGSAIVVLVASLIIALLIFGIDVSFRFVMKVVYSFFYV